MDVKKQIDSILKKIDDEKALKDILNIVNEIYILCNAGKWKEN